MFAEYCDACGETIGVDQGRQTHISRYSYNVQIILLNILNDIF